MTQESKRRFAAGNLWIVVLVTVVAINVEGCIRTTDVGRYEVCYDKTNVTLAMSKAALCYHVQSAYAVCLIRQVYSRHLAAEFLYQNSWLTLWLIGYIVFIMSVNALLELDGIVFDVANVIAILIIAIWMNGVTATIQLAMGDPPCPECSMLVVLASTLVFLVNSSRRKAIIYTASYWFCMFYMWLDTRVLMCGYLRGTNVNLTDTYQCQSCEPQCGWLPRQLPQGGFLTKLLTFLVVCVRGVNAETNQFSSIGMSSWVIVAVIISYVMWLQLVKQKTRYLTDQQTIQQKEIPTYITVLFTVLIETFIINPGCIGIVWTIGFFIQTWVGRSSNNLVNKILAGAGIFGYIFFFSSFGHIQAYRLSMLELIYRLIQLRGMYRKKNENYIIVGSRHYIDLHSVDSILSIFFLQRFDIIFFQWLGHFFQNEISMAPSSGHLITLCWQHPRLALVFVTEKLQGNTIHLFIKHIGEITGSSEGPLDQETYGAIYDKGPLLGPFMDGHRTHWNLFEGCFTTTWLTRANERLQGSLDMLFSEPTKYVIGGNETLVITDTVGITPLNLMMTSEHLGDIVTRHTIHDETKDFRWMHLVFLTLKGMILMPIYYLAHIPSLVCVLYVLGHSIIDEQLNWRYDLIKHVEVNYRNRHEVHLAITDCITWSIPQYVELPGPLSGDAGISRYLTTEQKQTLRRVDLGRQIRREELPNFVDNVAHTVLKKQPLNLTYTTKVNYRGKPVDVAWRTQSNMIKQRLDKIAKDKIYGVSLEEDERKIDSTKRNFFAIPIVLILSIINFYSTAFGSSLSIICLVLFWVHGVGATSFLTEPDMTKTIRDFILQLLDHDKVVVGKGTVDSLVMKMNDVVNEMPCASCFVMQHLPSEDVVVITFLMLLIGFYITFLIRTFGHSKTFIGTASVALVSFFLPMPWIYVVPILVSILQIGILKQSFGTVTDVIQVMSILAPFKLFFLIIGMLYRETFFSIISPFETLHMLMLIAFQCMIIGFVAFTEIYTSRWTGSRTLIIKDNTTGKVIAKEVKYGFLGDVLFGSMCGGIAGAVATSRDYICENTNMRDDILARWHAAPHVSEDGKVRLKLVKTLLENARKIGKVQHLLDEINDGSTTITDCDVGLRKTIDLDSLGVIRHNGQPIANASVINTDVGKLILTNAHVVCDSTTMPEMFSSGDDKLMKPLTNIDFDNGKESTKLELVTWSAASDCALLLPLRPLEVKGLDLGHLVIGKSYIWTGICAPLTDCEKKFFLNVRPSSAGVVHSVQGEYGDSGSILVDENGRVSALKYGNGKIDEVLNGISYVIPVIGLKHLRHNANRVAAVSLIDAKKFLKDKDYQSYIRTLVTMNDQIWEEVKTTLATENKADIDELLKKLGGVSADVKSLQKYVNGQLLVAKGKIAVHEANLKEDDEYQNLLRAIADITTEIKFLVSQIDQGGEFDDPAARELVDEIEHLRCLLLEKKLELNTKYKADPKIKEWNKQVGELGQKKAELTKKLKLFSEDQSSIAEVVEIKKQVTDINKVLIELGKQMASLKAGLQYDEISTTRMPGGLKLVRYPICLKKKKEDGTVEWLCRVSDDDIYITDKHPSYDKVVLQLAADFGYSESKWRRRLQAGNVSEQWYNTMFEDTQNTGIRNWILRTMAGGVCDYNVTCPYCDEIWQCDKEEHIDCARGLQAKVKRHMVNCPENRQLGKNKYVAKGIDFSLRGNNIVVDGFCCSKNLDSKHSCTKDLESYSAQRAQGNLKAYLYIAIKEDGKTKFYINQKCLEEAVGGSCVPTDNSQNDEEIQQMKSALSMMMKNFSLLEKRVSDDFCLLRKNEEEFKSQIKQLQKDEQQLASIITTTKQTNEALNVQIGKIREEVVANNNQCLDRCKHIHNHLEALDHHVNDISKAVNENIDEIDNTKKIFAQSLTESVDGVVQLVVTTKDELSEQISAQDFKLDGDDLKKTILDWQGPSDWELANDQRKRARKASIEKDTPKPPREEKQRSRSSSPKIDATVRRKAIFMPKNAHTQVFEDGCDCPFCSCKRGCQCDVCNGNVCIWCNDLGHATMSCSHAEKRECPHCNKYLGDVWWDKCTTKIADGQFGTDTVCCNKEEMCVICHGDGHTSLSCPVLIHGAFNGPYHNVDVPSWMNENCRKSYVLPAERREKKVQAQSRPKQQERKKFVKSKNV